MEEISPRELRDAEAQPTNAAWREFKKAPTIENLNESLIGFSSQYRPWAVLGLTKVLCGRRADAKFWPFVAEAWNGFDAIPHQRFQSAFRQHRRRWSPDCMSPDDRKHFDALPERFSVFRGQSSNDDVGLAWTLDYQVARGFANGHRHISVPNPVVFEAQLSKKDVAFVSWDRQEAEIVVFERPARTSCLEASSGTSI